MEAPATLLSGLDLVQDGQQRRELALPEAAIPGKRKSAVFVR